MWNFSTFTTPLSAFDLADRMDKAFNEQFNVKAGINTELLCNTYKDGDDTVIELDAPGAIKESFNISVTDGVLIAEWKRKRCGVDVKQSAKFALSKHADPKNIKATYQDGVLTLRISKKADSTVKIPVE